MKRLKIGLTTQIFIAMIAGTLSGIIFGSSAVPLKIIGDVWLNLIKLSIVPIVLCVIMTGIVGQKDGKTLGRISSRILLYYLFTTVCAAAIGLVVALFIEPGIGDAALKLAAGKTAKVEQITLAGFLNKMISSNMFKSFVDGNILQVLIIAILLGVATLRIKNEEYKNAVLSGIHGLNALFMSFIHMVMIISPIGVFCLMASALGSYGLELLVSIGSLTLVFYLSFAVQVLLVYCLTVWIFARITPWDFLRRTMPVWMFTIATCSSTAAIPVSLNTMTRRFSVDENISSFSIPLGSQVNHDGSAILFSCVIMFTAQISGTPFDIVNMLQAVLLGVLISAGGGGIPGAGIVKVFIMLEAFGLPTEIGAIVAAFYRVFDMGITTANCLGDSAGTIIIDRLERLRRGESANRPEDDQEAVAEAA
jgi:Na+/H+-dicarboxylate symporters